MDKDSFYAELSAEFGISVPKLNDMGARFGMRNGDINFALELHRSSKKPLDEVIDHYKKNKSNGWGFIAKEMGIKPGSPELKALKGKVKGKAGKIKTNKSNGKGKNK